GCGPGSEYSGQRNARGDRWTRSTGDPELLYQERLQPAADAVQQPFVPILLTAGCTDRRLGCDGPWGNAGAVLSRAPEREGRVCFSFSSSARGDTVSAELSS